MQSRWRRRVSLQSPRRSLTPSHPAECFNPAEMDFIMNVTPYHCTLVIPTYNAANFIDQTLDRLQRFIAQHPDWCVLFVCDGCSDNTLEKLSAAVSPSSTTMPIQSYDLNRGKGYALR